ncbi:MAG: response regulator [Candidatus Omnitrophota bacterium]|jgi:two-component system phosphate regulon response regulator PhoB|nr:MAG: response regulator [Candidatus Omnitrophota bacterium]
MGHEMILVVEDETDIRELVEYNLIKNGFRVTCTATGEESLVNARTLLPDLILLDIMLPRLDGLEVCRTLKNDPQTADIPIVMLTAKGEESDIVRGLEFGADDYITKPFSPKVLVARVKTVLRRKKDNPTDENAVINIHKIAIHPGRHQVLVEGRELDLTFTEFQVLRLLAQRPGWVFTRNQIIEAVRGDDYPVTDRSVDVQIVGLRRKLGDCGRFVETVRGVGYRLKE